MAARLATDLEPIPGYRLLERLGRGGFGEVWKAQAPGGMLKAIKFVYGNLNESAEDGKPAEQELKALNRVKSIRHPYILSLERFDVIDGQLLIVMELADRNLYDRFRECQEQGLPGIPRDELIRYMEEAAEALDLMNGQFQLQHLDIKPQNIFLVFNHIKVADFGLAKDLEGMQATLTGGVTPVYAAPETFECRVTRYCDQYSLAIVFQELLTGERPYNGSTARQLMMQHIQSSPDLSALPLFDRPVIGRALSKVPEQRFANCAELVEALKHAARSTPQRAIPEPARVPAGAGASSVPNLPATVPGARVKGTSAVGLRPSAVGGIRPSAAGLPALNNGHQKLPPLRNARGADPVANARQAPPEQTGNGELFPALVIGLGRFGLLVLQRLRRTLRDRYGKTALPHLRLLYVDTEAETLQSLNSSSAAVDPAEVVLARLNRPSHYNQQRPDLPPVAGWLNPQVLFRLPRQPATTGIRSLGRLALCDHFRTLTAKIRSDLEACTSTTALAEAAALTGHTLRTNRPRVYIVTSLMGGTGSGMFLDLAYVLRHELRLLGYKCPDVHSLLFIPEVNGDTSRSPAVANAYAALTELFHYNAPSTQYEALFDTKIGPIVDRERPFQRCMLLQVPSGGDSSALRPVLGTGASFLIQEMFTPIGREADKVRGETTRAAGVASNLQTCGTYRLTWPRRALWERSARRCCAHVVGGWAARDAAHLVQPVAEWVEAQWAEQRVDVESIQARLRDGLSDEPIKMADAVIDALSSSTQALELPNLCSALEEFTKLLGTPEQDLSAEGGRIGHELEQAARTIANNIQPKLTALVLSVIEQPGWRVTGAEEVIRQLSARLARVLEAQESALAKIHQESCEAFAKAYSLLGSVEASSRGSRRATAARDALVQMRHYAHQRVEFLMERALVHVLRTLRQFEPECQRDVQSYRQKLESLQQVFMRASSSSSRGYLGPERPLLPAGCNDLDEAAERIINEISATELGEFEALLLEQIRSQCKSFSSFLADKADQTRGLAPLLIEQARTFIGPRLRLVNPATVLFDGADADARAQQGVLEAYAQARPALPAGETRRDNELCVVSAPAGVEADRFGAAVQGALGDARPLTVVGSVDIIIHREVQSVGAADFPQLGPIAGAAFTHVAQKEAVSPHARDDVRWQPIERD